MYPFQSNSSLYPYDQSNLDLLLNEDEPPFEANYVKSPFSITPIYPMQPNHMNHSVHYNQPDLMNHSMQQNQDFIVHQGLAINQQVSIYHQVPQQYLNFQVQQQAPPHAPQSQVQPRPMEKPRLCWTWELRARFLLAAMELGGIFSATPRQILNRMNVKGLTVNQIKSHLQKVRLRSRKSVSASDGNGINYQSIQPVGIDAEEHPRLLERNEAPDNHQNLEIEQADNYFNFADFDFQII